MKRNLCVLFFCSILNFFSFSKSFLWDFDFCNIKDILFAISLDTGISISADDTVDGKGSLKFSGEDFESAFDAFLLENRLYVLKNKNQWIVSKFYFSENEEKFILDASDLLPVQILEKLSLNLKDIITYENLPNVKISVHFRDVSKKEMLENLGKRFGNYDVQIQDNKIHFVKIKENPKIEFSNSLTEITFFEENKISVNLKNSSFFETIEKLFECKKEKKDFCILLNGDVKISRTNFITDDFYAALKKICFQCGADFIENENIIYIITKNENKEKLINGESFWKKYYLQYAEPIFFTSFITDLLGKIENIILKDENSIYFKTNLKNHEKIEKYLSEFDIPQKTYLIELKYLKPAELLKNIPPSFNKNNIYLSDENGQIYFTGTEKEFLRICKEIENLDKPVKRIRYDLLILQYDESEQNDWMTSFNADRLHLGDKNNLSAQLGSVMHLNLNVITAFGLNFALKLQNSIEENNTKVFADTVLYGVNGKEINFQNTNTYRYRDNNLDPDTGKPIYSGVTREIISGIKIDISSWISGDEMITSSVTASISRQGSDTSSSTGNPPPTTEKIITTEVLGKSGEPIILSGLLQTSTTNQISRIPFLSKIPLIGKLFRKENKVNEKSQMIIYLVPHLDSFSKTEEIIFSENWASEKIQKLFALREEKNE